MPEVQVPIAKGVGRSRKDIDYVDALPRNMLAVPKEVLDAKGYMRSFPGLTELRKTNGASRGVMYNVKRNSVFRAIGPMLYENEQEVGLIALSSVVDERVKMACSATTQAVNAGGNVIFYKYDTWETTTLANWPTSAGYEKFNIGYVTDVVRNRGRYIWAQRDSQLFGVTDIDDETHPERYRPFYAAESQPDGIVCLGVWRDYVLCFGGSTVEYFGITGQSGADALLYQAQPSLMVNIGVAGRWAKCEFLDSYALLAGAANGQPGIFVLGTGTAEKVSTVTVDKIINSYPQDQLSEVILEAFRFQGHELLIVHLPDRTLCYDAAGSADGYPQWSEITSDLYGGVHRGIDYMYNGQRVTLADKSAYLIGELDPAISSQYGEQSEHILYSPMLRINGRSVFDLQLEAGTGNAPSVENLFVSVTQDGINYGAEQIIAYNKPYVYDRRIMMRRLGYFRKNVGFKIRAVCSGSVTLSDLRLRIE